MLCSHLLNIKTSLDIFHACTTVPGTRLMRTTQFTEIALFHTSHSHNTNSDEPPQNLNNMIRSPALPMNSHLATEEVCGDHGLRKRERSSSPATSNRSPPKRLFRRLDIDDCSVDLPSEAFIPSEDDTSSNKRQVRREMLALIEERLDSNEPRRTCLAKKLEALLFHNAPSFEIYADVETLSSRIRLAAIALVSRQRFRKAHEKKDRRQALIEALGESKVQQVCDIVKAVQDLRLRGAASSCRGTTTCCQKKLNIPGQRVMPPQVRNLFFETELIDAAENTPLDKISTLDWDDMIAQAQEHVKAFQEWSGMKTSFVDV